MNADSIIKVLDEVTARISGPAEKVWAIYVKQMIAYGVADLIGAALMLVAVTAWVLFARKTEWDFEPFEGMSGMVNFIMAILTPILLIWAGALVIRGSLFFISPEYYALERIIKGIK